MRITGFTCLAAIAAIVMPAQASGLAIDLLPGHPIYHESAQEAGVVMAIAITLGEGDVADLTGLCEELRVAAGLASRSDHVPLEVIFVVPYKSMAIEGYHLPADGAPGSEALIRGKDIARTKLDGIVARAGISARILDETRVEHEISCELGEPAWLLRWEDIHPLAGEQPETMIESAQRRFLTIHRSIIEHTTRRPRAADLRAPGVNPPAAGLAFDQDALTPDAGAQAVR